MTTIVETCNRVITTRNSRLGARPRTGPDPSRECRTASSEFGPFADGQLVTLYHKVPPSICHNPTKGYILFHLLHLFDCSYESLTFRVLSVVVQFRIARLHNPDRDKLSRSSIRQTTRELRICRFYFFSSPGKCTEIPRIPKRGWKDHQVTQVCRPCAPYTLYRYCPW